jgi:SAM-dependent methyltransferase
VSGWDTSRLHDRWQDDYERGRPGWPEAALDVVDVPADATVLELGAGTGKLTRLLVARFARVLVVEPDGGMRRHLADHAPDAELLDGTAEEIPVGNGSVDAVFAAEAFHRFEDRAVDEIARVLRPGAPLVLLWNLPAEPTDPAVNAASERLRERAPSGLDYDAADLNTRRYASGAWRRPFADAPFGPLEEAVLVHEQDLDRDALLAFFESMGWLSQLEGDEREAIVGELRTLLPDKSFRRSWETRVHWARSRPAG